MNRTETNSSAKFLPVLLTLLLMLPLMGGLFIASARENALRGQNDNGPRVLGSPQGGERHRRVRADRPGKGRHSISASFSRAGKSAGRGGKRFGRNISHGRPVRAGKELGKGMGGFGKHTGRGVARTMRRVFKP
jgi:hypothetical protein